MTLKNTALWIFILAGITANLIFQDSLSAPSGPPASESFTKTRVVADEPACGRAATAPHLASRLSSDRSTPGCNKSDYRSNSGGSGNTFVSRAY